MRGPSPQKWAQLSFGLHGELRDQVIVWHELTDAQNALSLDVLEQIFPAPASW